MRKTYFIGALLVAAWIFTFSGMTIYAQSGADRWKNALVAAERLAKSEDMVPIAAENEEDKEAIIRSITHIPGILTLKDGTTLQGDFRFAYRQTKEGLVVQEQSGIKDTDQDKVIWYFYKNEKGRDRSQAYKAKDVASFYMDETEIYDVIRYKPSFLETVVAGDGAIGLGSLGSIVGATKTEKFVMRIYKTDKVGIYNSRGLYIIHLNGTEEAIVGTFLRQKDLTKLAEGYPAVIEKVAQGVYDGETLDKYLLYVDDLTASMSGAAAPASE